MIFYCLLAFYTHSRVASSARRMLLGLYLVSAEVLIRAILPSDFGPVMRSWASAEPGEEGPVHLSLCAEARSKGRVSTCCSGDDGPVASQVSYVLAYYQRKSYAASYGP